jgi:hypothetical protein
MRDWGTPCWHWENPWCHCEVRAWDWVKGRRGEAPPPRPWLRPAAEALVVVRAAPGAHTRTGSQYPATAIIIRQTGE